MASADMRRNPLAHHEAASAGPATPAMTQITDSSQRYSREMIARPGANGAGQQRRGNPAAASLTALLAATGHVLR
jgi:hypothetical protein